jgi:alpha-tubulin suppressor-like RCC1 family protein
MGKFIMKIKKILAIILVFALLLPLSTIAPITSAETVPAQFTTTPMISTAERVSVALKQDGTVWHWGTLTQDIHSINILRNTPVQVPELTEIIDISAGILSSLALKQDGTVWRWRTEGGANENINVIQIPELTDVIAISRADSRDVALKQDGTVWSRGNNWNGELGNGAGGCIGANSNIPVQATGLTDVIAISAGSDHSLALKQDGTVWAWGSNWRGQLGNGRGGESYIRGLVPN